LGRTVLALTRIAFGLLILVAMITMIRFLVDEGSFNALNFFTFFTILSNLLAMGVLLEGGRRMLTGTPPIPDMIRGAAVVYMTVTYIVFAVLLRGLEEELQTHLAWVDSVFHRVAPIVLMLGWVVDPPKERIPFRRALWWLAFPLYFATFAYVYRAVVAYEERQLAALFGAAYQRYCEEVPRFWPRLSPYRAGSGRFSVINSLRGEWLAWCAHAALAALFAVKLIS